MPDSVCSGGSTSISRNAPACDCGDDRCAGLVDAISIGAGGNGGGAHSLQEWYDPAGREVGLKRALLTLLGVAGVVPEKR